MAPNTPTDSNGNTAAAAADVDIKFAHIQLYADHVCPVQEYKKFEAEINTFHENFEGNNDNVDDAAAGIADSGEAGKDKVRRGQELWTSMQGGGESEVFVPHGRDVVKVRQAFHIRLVCSTLLYFLMNLPSV